MAEQLELVRAPLPGLRPFWRYYGGKWRAAPMYPQPMHRRLVEPFAGAAGYSLRYPEHDVVLVEANAALAEIWRFLIEAEPHEILGVPLAEHIDDVLSWVPEGMRNLIRQLFAAGSARPQNWLSPGFVRQFQAHPTWSRGWDDIMRRRIAAQVPRIKHWRIVEGDYTCALELLDGRTTSFWDPPYCSPAGAKYAERPRGTPEQRAAWYAELGERIRAAPGQVIVCENEGATWLPFRKFGTFRRGMNGAGRQRSDLLPTGRRRGRPVDSSHAPMARRVGLAPLLRLRRLRGLAAVQPAAAVRVRAWMPRPMKDSRRDVLEQARSLLAKVESGDVSGAVVLLEYADGHLSVRCIGTVEVAHAVYELERLKHELIEAAESEEALERRSKVE